MGIALGPDLWDHAPDKSSPISDLRAWLGTMAAAAAAWTPSANESVWRERFAGVQTAIADALAALPPADVFARPTGAQLYETACKRYQDTKDAFITSSDWLLTASQQAGDSPVPPGLLDQAAAFLRSLGLGLAGAALLLIVVVIVVRRAVS